MLCAVSGTESEIITYSGLRVKYSRDYLSDRLCYIEPNYLFFNPPPPPPEIPKALKSCQTQPDCENC